MWKKGSAVNALHCMYFPPVAICLETSPAQLRASCCHGNTCPLRLQIMSRDLIQKKEVLADLWQLWLFIFLFTYLFIFFTDKTFPGESFSEKQ